ncbi:MAG: anti-sigma F factor [Clostridiales bacterium]|nr:anti-sigma F factor [Clostridiales bacterium]
MRVDNVMSVEFLSKSENESFARVVAAAFAAALNPTAGEIAEIKTAVSEAVTNAIIHGYENSVGMVKMEGRIHGRTVEFTISDDGWGIADVEEARQPLYTGKPDMERSGMGFSIMESFMDRVEVKSRLGEGTRVKMSKTIEL